MDRGLCIFCRLSPITGRNRKYCDEHSRLASTIWKRQSRRIWKDAGDQYWLSDWKHKSSEERKAYFRTYMRQYRKRSTANSSPSKVDATVTSAHMMAAN
jgi:hypothetical protein